MGWADVFTIISNLWFLAPAIKAFYKKRITRMVLYLGILINSSIYHTCNSFAKACWLPADVHRKYDFFFAMMQIPSTGLFLIYFPKEETHLERMLLFVFALGISYAQNLLRDSLYVQLVLTGVTLAIVTVYWIVYAIKTKGRFPPYNWEAFGMGVALTGLSCMLYVSEMDNHTMYWAIHSVWHINAANAQFWLLDIRDDMPPEGAVMDQKIGKRLAHKPHLLHLQ